MTELIPKKIKAVYDANPTAGEDTATEGYTPYDNGTGSETARSDTQLSAVVSDRLDLPLSLGSLSSAIATLGQELDASNINIATNAQAISDIQDTLGNLITEAPGDIQWEAVSSAVNEGSNVTIRLNRVNYGFQPPDATYTSTVTWAGDAPIAGDSMELDGVAYTSGANIDWTQADIFHVITYNSSADSITSDGTVTLTSAAASPMADGSPVLNTLTITNDGATSAPGTFAFASSGYSDTEERSPVQTLTIGRTGGSDGDATINYTLANISAVAGENYVQHTSSSIVIGDGVTSGAIDLQTVYKGITSNKSLSCTIDSVSIGAIGAQDSTTITINKLAGFWSQPASAAGSADGDVDWNTCDPLTQLTEYAGSRTQTGGTVTIDKVWIDASSDATDLDTLQFTSATDIDISNLYILNASRAAIHVFTCTGIIRIRNIFVNGSGKDTTSTASNTYGIYSNNCDDATHELLNNKFENCNGDIIVNECERAINTVLSWNYTDGPWRENGKATSAIAFISSRNITGTNRVDHNVHNCPRELYGGTGAGGEDVYTLSSTRANSESEGVQMRWNRSRGGGGKSLTESNSTVFHTGEGNGRRAKTRYNTAVEILNTGCGLTGGTDNFVQYNRTFSSFNKPGLENAFGWHIWRSPGSAPGEMDMATYGYNHSSTYQQKPDATPLIKNRWFPDNGADGDSPNHGPGTIGDPSTMPDEWGSTRFDSGTNIDNDTSDPWQNDADGTAGYNALWFRKRVLVQPANVSFIFIENASHDATVGFGTLSYDGAGSITWAEFEDTAGTAIDLTGTNPVTGSTYAVGDMFTIETGSHDSGDIDEYRTLELILTATPSGGSASDADILVSDIDHYTSHFWAGENGDLS